jgi:hypothetical protein
MSDDGVMTRASTMHIMFLAVLLVQEICSLILAHECWSALHNSAEINMTIQACIDTK